MPQIDELCLHLRINHPLHQTTCIGHALRKPTCGCAVAIASRTSAVNVLRTIDRDIRAGKKASQSDLKNVASLLLCERFHQNQADHNVCDWERQLQSWSKRFMILKSTGTPNRGAIRSSEASSSQLEDKYQALQEKYDKMRSRYENLKGRFESLQSDFDSLQEDYEDLQDDHETLQENCESHPDIGDRLQVLSDEVVLTELERRLEHVTNPQMAAAVVGLATAALSRKSEGARSIATEPAASEGSSTPVRQSHLDCSICLQPYADNATDFWECQQCQNRVHAECFDSWAASRVDNGGAHCIFCRIAT